MPESRGLAALPPSVFDVVINHLVTPDDRPKFEGDEFFHLDASRSVRQRALGSLSTVNEGIRKLAQPLIFDQVNLAWVSESITSRAQNLVWLFDTRPESTGWIKTLHLQLETFPPPDVDLFTAVSNLLAHLNGLRTLHLARLYDVVVDAPPQLFTSVTALHISDTPSHINLDKLVMVLSRCHNLASLTCGFPGDARRVEIPPTTIPLLSRLKGPMSLAKLMVPGRPVEIVDIVPSWSPGGTPVFTPEDLRPLTLGSKPLRRIGLPTVQWGEDALQMFASLFPSLERLWFRVGLDHKDWLQGHLIEMVQHFPRLENLKMTALPPIGPPSEETLATQLEALKAASAIQPRLQEVAFLDDVKWISEGNGFWTAVYHSRIRQTMYLTPRRDMDGGIRKASSQPHISSINSNDRLSALPAELLLHIVNFLRHHSFTATYAYSSPAPPKPLKSLCLTSRMLSAIAQPALFEQIQLSGRVREALFVARKLEKMFAAREGSARWVQTLFMFWDPPSNTQQPGRSDNEVVEQLDDVITRLLGRMSNLRTLHMEQTKLSYQAYSQIYRLPRLKRVVVRGIEIFNRPLDDDLDVNDLAITDLTILRRLGRQIPTQPPGLPDPLAIKLARSPSLQRLHTWDLSHHTVAEILGPSPGHSLTTLTALEVPNPTSPFDSLLSLAPHSPNLLSLHFGTSTRRGPLGHPTPAVTTPSTVPNDIWPLLKEFRGSLAAAQLLVPGRPVEKIRVVCSSHSQERWDRSSLIPLVRGSAVVKELALKGLSWRAEGVDEIAELFPHVEDLEITTDGPHQAWLSSKLLRVVKLFPHLRSISIAIGIDQTSFHLPRNESLNVLDVVPLLQEARALRPTLAAVDFGSGTRWNIPDGEKWIRADPWGLYGDIGWIEM